MCVMSLRNAEVASDFHKQERQQTKVLYWLSHRHNEWFASLKLQVLTGL